MISVFHTYPSVCTFQTAKKYGGSFVDHTYCCSSYGWGWPSTLDWSAHERRPSCAPSHPECLASFKPIPSKGLFICKLRISLWGQKAGRGLAVLAPLPLGRPAQLHISIVVVRTKIMTWTLFLYDSAPSKGTLFFAFCFNVFATYSCSCFVHMWESTKRVARKVNTVKTLNLSFHSHFLMSSVVYYDFNDNKW